MNERTDERTDKRTDTLRIIFLRQPVWLGEAKKRGGRALSTFGSAHILPLLANGCSNLWLWVVAFDTIKAKPIDIIHKPGSRQVAILAV